MTKRPDCRAHVRASSALLSDGMPITLTDKEVELLKQLKAAGVRGHTVRALNSDAALARLFKEGYVTAQTANLDLIRFYRITRSGEEALTRATDAAV